MNAALDSTWWSDWTGDLALQGELVTLMVASVALVWLLLLVLFHGHEAAAEDGPSGGLLLPFDSAGMVAEATRSETYEARVPLPVAPGPSAVSAEACGSLQGSYLSPTDVIALTALRGRIRSGRVVEDPIDARRLEFARWLVEQGRLLS